jgi:hypothetical protein
MNLTSSQRIPARSLALSLAFVLSPSLALADVVTEWNEIAENAVLAGSPPPMQFRTLAITQIAVHDALNAVTPRYETYTAQPPAPAGASANAAAIAAAYRALSQLVPAQAAALQLKYENRIAELPPCAATSPNCIADGIATGTKAANDILALRTGDGSATPHRPYTLAPGPGVYQLTPPAMAAPAFAGWAEVTPFALNSASQFRAGPSELLDLGSDTYARDFNEVKAVGSAAVRGANPDSKKSQIARYWAGGGANWNSATRVIVAGRGMDAWQHARLFALLNMAISDGLVTVFETKYHYNFWRPITAIRQADTDGNAATAADPNWTSYLAAPPYADYTSGLCTVTGAATEVLRRVLKTDRIVFSHTAAGIQREFVSLSHADADAVDGRVYSGIHFRTADRLGIVHGAQVGRFVFQHQLKAL